MRKEVEARKLSVAFVALLSRFVEKSCFERMLLQLKQENEELVRIYVQKLIEK